MPRKGKTTESWGTIEAVTVDRARVPPHVGRLFTAVSLWLCVAACSSAIGAIGGPCNAPCLQGARVERQTCTVAATQSFLDGIDGCVDRDHTCVNACRWQRQVCREDTGLRAQLADCLGQTQQARTECRSKFAFGSKKLENCVDQAQLAGFQCRKAVRQNLRRPLRQCRRAFAPCARLCGPGQPPLGSRVCKAQERRTLQTALADCKATFIASARGCANRDGACIQDCVAAREQCTAPTQATLDAALAACRAAEAAAVAACPIDPDRSQCIATAQSNAFVCRDDAAEAARPGFAACTQQYLGCVDACPAI